MVRLRILLVLVAVATSVACENGPRPDAVSERLLDRYDIEAAGATTTQEMEVGGFADEGVPWEVYLAASQQIGLDFSEHFGAPAGLHTTPSTTALPACGCTSWFWTGGRSEPGSAARTTPPEAPRSSRSTRPPSPSD